MTSVIPIYLNSSVSSEAIQFEKPVYLHIKHCAFENYVKLKILFNFEWILECAQIKTSFVYFKETGFLSFGRL